MASIKTPRFSSFAATDKDSKAIALQRYRALMFQAVTDPTLPNSGRPDVQIDLQVARSEALDAGATEGELNDIVHEYRRPPNRAYVGKPALVQTRLNVPYADKDRAKAAGARWDSKLRVWYAPAGADLNKFRPWLTSPTSFKA